MIGLLDCQIFLLCKLVFKTSSSYTLDLSISFLLEVRWGLHDPHLLDGALWRDLAPSVHCFMDGMKFSFPLFSHPNSL